MRRASSRSTVHGPLSLFKGLGIVLFSTFCLLSTALAQTNQVTPTWTFETFGLQSYGSKRVVITPLSAIGNNGNLLAVGDPIRGTTTNSSFTTNLLNGSYYRVEFYSGYNVYALTNFFDANTTGAVDGGNPLYRAFGQNQDRSAYGFSGIYSLAIFMLKVSGVATNAAFYGSLAFRTNGGESAGWVWTLTNTATGQGDWQAPTGGGGGGGTGNVTGPNSSTIGAVAVFSSTDGKHIGDGGTLGSAAFQPTSSFEPAGSASAVQAFATAYSNSVNIASGNSAAVSTNRFITPFQLAILSNNINGANIFGQVPASSLGSGSSISTKFLRGDLTWQSIIGGGDMLAANNLSDVANTATALANLNGVPNTRSISISASTANQVVVSAGSQNLTADRSWGLSLSPTLVLSGTLEIDGASMTNAGNWSNRGRGTNFGDFYAQGALEVDGNQTNAGNVSVSGNQTNLGTLRVSSPAYFVATTNTGAASISNLIVTADSSVGGNETVTGNSTVGGTIQGTSVKVTSATAGTVAIYDTGGSLTSIAAPPTTALYVLTETNLGTPVWRPSLNGSALKASQYITTDAGTNLISTQNAGSPGWTNLVTAPAMGHTNIVMEKLDGSMVPYDLAALLALGGGGGTVTAGTNIVVDSSAGPNTVSVKDPEILGQINVTTAWLTNALAPTNAFAGTVIDVSKTENGITNLGGNLTFTGVANITAGGLNSAVVQLFAGGSTRTIDVADASMHKETNWNTTLPAGWEMDVMVRVNPGIRTNFYQIIIP